MKDEVSTSLASVQTREISDLTSDHILPVSHIREPYKIDAKPFINRPFFVTEVKWETTQIKYKLLPCFVSKLPTDIINSNPTLLNGLKMGSLYRMSGQLNISVAGTITHAGCLLVGIIPPLNVPIDVNIPQELLVNTILSGPHAFLFANEATSVLLDIPWYCNTDYDSLDVDKSAAYKPAMNLNYFPGNFATLVMLVLNPLQASAGGSTTLSVIVEANLTNLEISVPTPRYVTYTPQSYFMNLGTSLLDSAASYAKKLTGDAIDGLRQGVKYYTGLHNPNNPQVALANIMLTRNRLNNVDTTQYIENLDPNANFVRVVNEPIFNTKEDEMAIKHIISKKQFIGTFRVNQNDAVGTLLFSRPISPNQGGLQAVLGTNKANIANNIEALHFLTRAWKGDIKIHIQSVMNNKQQVKLRLIQLYNPSSSVLTGYPNYNTILQAPSHLMEFTQGGQTREVILPYLCRNQLTLCARECNMEALFHGMYYIYVAQPLANSSDSPSDIFFNVYISLEDNFTFHGYSTELGFSTGPFKAIDQPGFSVTNKVGSNGLDPLVEKAFATKKINDDKADEEKIKKVLEEQMDKVINNDIHNLVMEVADGLQEKNEENEQTYEPQSVEVMNEPQKQTNSDLHKGIHLETNHRLLPLVDIRPIIRRLYPEALIPIALNPNVTLQQPLALDPIIGESTLLFGGSIPSNPATLISRMYYGKECGIKMRLKFVMKTGNLPYLDVKVFYSPTQFYPEIQGNNVIAKACNTSIVNPGFTFGSDAFPLNNISTKGAYTGEYVYEFVIPNTNPFKFIGGPRKMLVTAPDNEAPTADSDFGNLQIVIKSPVAATADLTVEFAFTDESRFGFHSIAPLIARRVSADTTRYITPGAGNIGSPSDFPLVALTPPIYYTRR